MCSTLVGQSRMKDIGLAHEDHRLDRGNSLAIVSVMLSQVSISLERIYQDRYLRSVTHVPSRIQRRQRLSDDSIPFRISSSQNISSFSILCHCREEDSRRNPFRIVSYENWRIPSSLHCHWPVMSPGPSSLGRWAENRSTATEDRLESKNKSSTMTMEMATLVWPRAHCHDWWTNSTNDQSVDNLWTQKMVRSLVVPLRRNTNFVGTKEQSVNRTTDWFETMRGSVDSRRECIHCGNAWANTRSSRHSIETVVKDQMEHELSQRRQRMNFRVLNTSTEEKGNQERESKRRPELILLEFDRGRDSVESDVAFVRLDAWKSLTNSEAKRMNEWKISKTWERLSDDRSMQNDSKNEQSTWIDE